MDGKESCKGKLEAASISDILFLFGQGNFFFLFPGKVRGSIKSNYLCYITERVFGFGC